MEVPIFHAYRHSLSQEFNMDSGLVTSAKLFLHRVAKDTGAQLFVGMHVRRTDYAVWLKEKVKGRLLSKMVGLNFKQFYFLISVKIKRVDT